MYLPTRSRFSLIALPILAALACAPARSGPSLGPGTAVRSERNLRLETSPRAPRLPPPADAAQPTSGAASDERAVYEAVLARVWGLHAPTVGEAGGTVLVADRTYTCVRRPTPIAAPVEDGATVAFGRTLVTRLRISPDARGPAPDVRLVTTGYLASHVVEGLAVYFSPVIFLDEARSSAVMQVLSGRGARDFTCATWMLERRGAVFVYVRGEGPPRSPIPRP